MVYNNIHDTMIRRPEEIWAAATMLIPSIVGLMVVLSSETNASMFLSLLGCVIHCPFSFALHIHRAMSDDVETRTVLYKFDASAIHFHALLQGIAWTMTPQKLEILFHVGCITHIIVVKPLQNPKVKHRIDVLCAIGIIISSFGMFHRCFVRWVVAHLLWVVAFSIYRLHYSNALFHTILAGPQYCLISSLSN